MSTLRELVGPHGASVQPPDVDMQSPLTFLDNHIHPRTGGQTVDWSFAGREYLQDIVEDDARDVAIMKAAQVGISTIMIADMLRHCLAGYKAGWYLETDDEMGPFVQDRFNPLIDADPHLVRSVVEGELKDDAPRRRGKRADNIRLLHIGKGSAYLSGLWKRSRIKSRDLDAIYLDEYEEAADATDDEGNRLVDYVPDRLQASPLKRQRKFSQPGVPGMGIGREFDQGDQRHFLHKCARCKSWTAVELVYPNCLMHVADSRKGRRYRMLGEFARGAQMPRDGAWRIVCPKCKARLRGDGVTPTTAWTPAHPGRAKHSYCVSQLYGPHMTPADIAERHLAALGSTSKMATVMVSVVGRAHAGDRQPLTESRIHFGAWKQSRSAPVPGRVITTVDVGDVLWVMSAVHQAGGAIHVFSVESFVDDAKMIPRLKRLKGGGLIDSRPEHRLAKRICRELPGWAMVRFANVEENRYDEEDRLRIVAVPRNDCIDAGCDLAVNGDLIFPKRTEPGMDVLVEHLSRLVRDPKQEGGFRYKRNVENHLGLCLAMQSIAADPKARKLLKLGGGQMNTRGYRSAGRRANADL